MARLDKVDSDHESSKGSPRSKRKSSINASPKERKISMEVDQVEEIEHVEVPDDSESATEGEGGGEEEYEIEAILDAKKGAFAQGRTGYFVKWKGYGEAENSWVDEKDAGNATDLIDEYWRKVKKEKQGRKSLDNKPKSRRKSTTTTREVNVEAGQAKKRNRPRADKEAEAEVVSDDGDEPVTKKPRKSNGAKVAANTRQDDDDDSQPVGDMKKYLTIPSWESLVDSVDTVERSGKDLVVYFTLKKTQEHVMENSKICAEKFPKKMLEFYESNLRWKTDDESASLEAS